VTGPLFAVFCFGKIQALFLADALAPALPAIQSFLSRSFRSAQVPVLISPTQLRGRFRTPSLHGLLPLLLALLFPCFLPAADCIPITEARQHVGEERCVTGRVVRVKHGSRGVTFFDFCQDSMVCPFTVVVFPHDLRSIGDVSQLQNKVIEVHGPVKEYDGRAEIVLQQLRQLGGEGRRIPPLPKDYDVENKGHYSAGKFSLPRAPHKTYKKRQTAKLPIQIPSDDGSTEEANAPQ
jgi:DNA/RNA endonuclease YhcR with UshA esterase domain